ncbi:MAG TPA: hypothetical protein VHE35_29945 [Kofleriaceae bacterium]|nr:hypothetical protein [Kofleriaceae bacterium]
MGQLRSTGFVGADTLELIAWPKQLVMVGDIGCLGDLSITVEKYLRVVTPGARPADVLDGDHDISVETYVYSYHASVRCHGAVFRYDNNHGRPGHADWHHVHRCDWRSDDDVGQVEWIGEARWPTLGDAIRELSAWYYEHRDALPSPDEYAAPLQRQPRILWNPTV